MKRTLINSTGFAGALVALLVAAAALGTALSARADDIVDHPDKLKFKKLDYKPPKPKEFRYKLDCGATAFVAENREVPTLQVTVLVRTGTMYELPAVILGLVRVEPAPICPALNLLFRL